MDDFTSVSKGCFVVKPSKRRDVVSELNPVYKEEEKESLANRYQKFYDVKEIFDKAIKNVFGNINKETTKQIIDFVLSNVAQSTNIGISTLTIKEGVNFAEFSPIYHNSSKELITKHNLRCVTLKTLPNMEINALLKEIFSQLINHDKQDEDKVLIKTLSMKDLFEKIAADRNCSGIVILVPRFDVLPSATVEKFIEICASRRDDIQLIFVFGLSTGFELSTEWMSSSSLANLSIETLNLPSPTVLLEKVLFESLLCSSTPFKLSYRAFEVLLSRFSFVSYSVKDVMKIVHVALLHHTFNQPLFQYIQIENNNCAINVEELLEIDKALILQLPSVQKHIEKMVVSNKPHACKLLEGDTETITQLQQDCNENYTTLYLTFKILHSLIKNIQGNSLVSKPLELYSFCIQGCVHKVREVCVALKCLGMMQVTDFLDRLKSALAEVQDDDESVPNKIKLLLRVISSQVEEIDCELNSTEDKHVIKQKIKTLQTSFISRLENFLSTLNPPDSWPMYEISWFSSHIELQNLLVGKCRTSLHRGLTHPNLYLQGTDETPKPDVCQVYELFHEHGRLISLHDWIQSFNSLLGKKKITTETHARFIRAVSELHFMGYLKPTKRKTDHVAKLSLLGY